MSLKILQRRREARDRLEEVFSQPQNVFEIHYSCEGFYQRTDGRSPRITSIAVRDFGSGQTQSFSIHKRAELDGVDLDGIESQYDALEKAMLDDFFDHVRRHNGRKYLHWNMRDINYGFPAIEHRYAVLGGDPEIIPDANKYDLSRILISLYGPGYIDHPRLPNLLEKNRIGLKDFLTGQDEADAFDRKDYVALHQSTLRKVDVISNIAHRTYERSLKTNLTWFEHNMPSVRAAADWFSHHWIVTLVGAVGVVGAAIVWMFGLVS